MSDVPREGSGDERLRAAIGPRADYYLRRWRAMDEKGKAYDWNWAACLLNVFWFAYRKLWGPMAAMALAYVVATPLLDPARHRLIRIVAGVLIALSFVTGSYGNRLYRAKAERIAAEAATPEAAAARGGVSLGAAIGAVVVVTVLSSLAGMVPALLGRS